MGNLDKARMIIDSLCDRAGFDDWWYDIGEENQDEITINIIEILDK